jgi:hypothetical protein
MIRYCNSYVDNIMIILYYGPKSIIIIIGQHYGVVRNRCI